MKKWLRRVQYKREKPFISIVITLAIVLMLILSGPANAVQVSVNATRLDNLRVGETGSFYVNVTIGANERIPITNVSVEGLPEIEGSPGGMLIFNVSDFDKMGDFWVKGNYNISLIEQYGLVKGFGYGYGYVNNSGSPPYSGYGDSYQFYGYGYGYGYDSGSSTSYTKLVYKIAINTTGAEAKQYEAVVKVNAGNDVKGRSVAFEDSLSFSLQPASPSVPGSPSITDFAPKTSSVTSFIGEAGKFSITANQTVNVTWYINGTEVFSQTATNESSYTNNSAALGTWIINATARNANGTVSKEWTWIVKEPSSPARIRASVEIKPETLNLASKGKFKAFITLGEGYSAADIDPETVICEGAHAIKWKISKKKGGTLIVTFNRQDLVNVPAGDDVALRVTGELFDGTPFEGSDTIRVIDRGKKQHHDDEFEDDEDEDDEDEDDEDEDDEDEENEYSESGNHYINEEQKHHKEVDGRTHGKGKKKDKK